MALRPVAPQGAPEAPGAQSGYRLSVKARLDFCAVAVVRGRIREGDGQSWKARSSERLGQEVDWSMDRDRSLQGKLYLRFVQVYDCAEAIASSNL